jgi:hypothetical protein
VGSLSFWIYNVYFLSSASFDMMRLAGNIILIEFGEPFLCKISTVIDSDYVKFVRCNFISFMPSCF